jgi:hypothetical protein
MYWSTIPLLCLFNNNNLWTYLVTKSSQSIMIGATDTNSPT